jgi:WD40 repeat protein
MGNNLKKEATCNICNKILIDPFHLPCKCANICHEHIETRQANKKLNVVKCVQCGREFELSAENFIKNQILDTKIKTMQHLTSRERKSLTFVQDKFNQMEMLMTNMDEKVNEFTMMGADHFYNIKNEIDIKRETLLEELHLQQQNNANQFKIELLVQESKELIDRVEQGEETYWRIFNKEIKSNLVTINIDHERQQIIDFYRKINLSDEDLEYFENDFKFKFMSLKDNLNRFESFRILLNENYFKPCAGNSRLGDLFLNLNTILLNFNLIYAQWYSRWINVCNLQTNKHIQSFRHTEEITGLSLYGQNRLASVSRSGSDTIKFWNVLTGECLKTLDAQSVHCIKLLKNGNLATGSGLNKITIWDLTSFKLKFALHSNERNEITCLDQLSNEWLVSSGCFKDCIEIWDLNERVCVRIINSSYSFEAINKAKFCSYNNKAYHVTCLKALEKGNEILFAAGTSSGIVCVWNAPNGSCFKEFQAYKWRDRWGDRYGGSILNLELRTSNELICFYERINVLIDLTSFEQQLISNHNNSVVKFEPYGNEIVQKIQNLFSKYNIRFAELDTTI